MMRTNAVEDFVVVCACMRVSVCVTHMCTVKMPVCLCAFNVTHTHLPTHTQDEELAFLKTELFGEECRVFCFAQFFATQYMQTSSISLSYLFIYFIKKNKDC